MRRPRWTIRAVVFAALLAAAGAAALWLADRAMKRAEGPWPLPDGAQWRAAWADFPRFWQEAQNLPPFDAGAPAPEAWRQLEACFEDLAGLEATPGSWRRWLGPRLAVTVHGGAWGACVRPGLALRGRQMFRNGVPMPEDPRIRRVGNGTYCAWRAGALVFSPHAAFVAAALDSAAAVRPPLRGPREMGAAWSGPHEGRVYLQAGREWIASGHMRGRFPASGRPMTLTESWPAPPVLALHGGNPAALGALLTGLGAALTGAGTAQPQRHAAAVLFDHWGWRAPPVEAMLFDGECALAVTRIDAETAFPVPDLAVVFRADSPLAGDHPLEALTRGTPVMPARWAGEPGLRAPLLGERATLCLGRHGRCWLAASNEPALARLAGRLAPGAPVDADALIELDWRRTAQALQAVTRRAARLGLLPRMNQTDWETRWRPWFEAVEGLGTVRFEILAEHDRAAFFGALALREE